MGYPSKYPSADGPALDALAANMGIARRAGEDDAAMRERVVAYIREPVVWRPIGRRQATAIWLARHGMPTFAEWLCAGYWWRISERRFVGEMPPRWVMERNLDGGFSWP